VRIPVSGPVSQPLAGFALGFANPVPGSPTAGGVFASDAPEHVCRGSPPPLAGFCFRCRNRSAALVFMRSNPSGVLFTRSIGFTNPARMAALGGSAFDVRNASAAVAVMRSNQSLTRAGTASRRALTGSSAASGRAMTKPLCMVCCAKLARGEISPHERRKAKTQIQMHSGKAALLCKECLEENFEINPPLELHDPNGTWSYVPQAMVGTTTSGSLGTNAGQRRAVNKRSENGVARLGMSTMEQIAAKRGRGADDECGRHDPDEFSG
jgi:hypothetical protein